MKKFLCFLLSSHSYNEDTCINYEYPSGAVLVKGAGHCRRCGHPDFALRWDGLE